MAAASKYDWPAILHWIRETYRETGWPVSVRLIIRAYFGGGVSTSVIHYQLRKWVAQGDLECSPLVSGFKPPHKTIIL